MHKRLCACGCGDRVTPKVESQHMNALAPAALASQVLDQNRRLVRRKKKSKAIGFPASFRQRLAMGNTTEIDDRVTPKVESQHMNALAPAVQASQVLVQNRKLVHRKKKSKAIGFHAPSRQQLAMGNTTDIDDMDIDDNDPVSLDSSESMMDLDEAYGSGQFAPHVERSKFFQKYQSYQPS
jgi:hypothetical protein